MAPNNGVNGVLVAYLTVNQMDRVRFPFSPQIKRYHEQYYNKNMENRLKKCYTRYQAGLFDPDFPQGKLFRVIFDPPITLMKDDRIEISIKVK